MKDTITINVKGNHKGASTHHQDQSITFTSLSTINATVSNTLKLAPPSGCTVILAILVHYEFLAVGNLDDVILFLSLKYI